MSGWRVWLWRFGLKNEFVCPVCMRRLVPHGFEGNNRAYTCPEDLCEFNRGD